MEDRGDQEANVAGVDPGDGIAELDRYVSGEAGGGFPVDRGCRGAVADEALEVAASGPASVGDDQPGAGFECVEAVSAGAERGLEWRAARQRYDDVIGNFPV